MAKEEEVYQGPERRRDRVIIHEELSGIRQELALLNQGIKASEEQRKLDYKRHQDSLEKHEGTLYGNGQPGLTTKVKSLLDELAIHRWVIGVILLIVGLIFGRVH